MHSVETDLFTLGNKAFLTLRGYCFRCLQLNEGWHRIGYVVTEALDHVHKSLVENRIIYVKFAWVKYVVVWRRCGPGYYAGIHVALADER